MRRVVVLVWPSGTSAAIAESCGNSPALLGCKRSRLPSVRAPSAASPRPRHVRPPPSGESRKPGCEPRPEVFVKSATRSCLQRVPLATASIFLCLSTIWDREILSAEPPRSPAEAIKRKASLETILRLLPPDRTSNGRVSFLDETFKDWLSRTGELPPDFDRMPSIPLLPDPLVLDEGAKNVPVTTMEQWKEKREWMKRQLEYYITGTRPPEPDNVKATVLGEKNDGEITLRTIELTFGPENRATLTVELMIPPGKGPFPVFLTQWNHREWAQVAVRRGYVGCVYAGADGKDDTEKYSEIWAGKYDFTRLMRRAYGASRPWITSTRCPSLTRTRSASRAIPGTASNRSSPPPSTSASPPAFPAAEGPVRKCPGATARSTTTSRTSPSWPAGNPVGCTRDCGSSSAGRTSCPSIRISSWP